MQQAELAKRAEREAMLHRWSLAHASVGSGDVHAAASEPASGAAWHMVAGDASFRRYFRLVVNARSFIAMDAPPPQENVATFTNVAGLMRAAHLRVPAIYAEDTAMGFLLLEDFGDHMVREELAADRGQQLFDWILPTLGRMAGCETAGLPLFDAAAMQRELDLFTDWYLARHCQFEPDPAQRQRWQSLCEHPHRNCAGAATAFRASRFSQL